MENIPFSEMSDLGSLDETARALLMQTLRAPGANVIVTTPEPPPNTGFRWRRLGNTEYFEASLLER